MESFQDCITFHLLDMFPGNAAEQQHFHISNVLQKPQQVPVRYFFQQVEQLNSYLSHLPCTYESPRATAATKPVQSFDKAELANLLLRMCPESWQDQYDLTQDSLPQGVTRKLLGILENVKKVVANSNAKERAKKESTEKATGKRKKGKRKGSSSTDYCIPKKVRSEKGCALCQKHGGAHTTHNTSECRKYEKDGTLKKTFNGKAAIGSKHHGNGKKDHANSFAQFMERFSKLEKAFKKTQKNS
jgi:hypothetical protein